MLALQLRAKAILEVKKRKKDTGIDIEARRWKIEIIYSENQEKPKDGTEFLPVTIIYKNKRSEHA